MSKEAKDIPIDHIRHCLDGAARDNTFYQWLLDACDIIEDLREDLRDDLPTSEEVRKLMGWDNIEEKGTNAN